MKRADDFLSPILVKEFRQGVRGNVFTSSFLLLHGLMVLAMSLSLVDVTNNFLMRMFWPLLLLPIGVMVPLSGAQALSSEAALKTLEPMLLTRLSPRAIVLGKWASLALQDLILLVSIAPYMILRYFLGGLDFSQEAWGTVDLALSAGVLGAMSVAFSAFAFSAVFRWVVCLPLMFMLVGTLQPLFLNRSGLMGTVSLVPPLAAIAMGVLTMLLMVEAGAWQIAPAADRSSSRARIVALLGLPALALAVRDIPHQLREPASFVIALLASLLAVSVLNEPITAIPGMYARYLRGSVPRRAAGWLLAPGWASGVMLIAVCGLAACGLGSAFALTGLEKTLCSPDVVAAIAAALFLPVLVRQTLPRVRARPLAVYAVVQVVSWMLGSLAPLGEGLDLPWLSAFGVWLLPLSPILKVMLEHERPQLTSPPIDVLGRVVCGAIIALTVWRAGRALLGLRRLVQERDVPEVAPRPDDAASTAA
jgi:hypothetical protein